MLCESFFDYCGKLMEEIRRDEKESMEAAAEMIAEAVSKSRTFMIHDRGHLIGGELLARAGGAAFVRKFDLPIPDPSLLNAHTGTRAASRERLPAEERTRIRREFEEIYADYAMDVNGLSEGDVLLLNSNSGYGFAAVNLARAARKKGVKLIVMSSKQTADAITPEGGEKKLSEYADILLDNHAPYGDAVFEVDGLDEKLWPASGMGAAFIAWPIVLMAVEKLLQRGISPTIFRSANIPGGPEQNKRVVERYEELGY